MLISGRALSNIILCNCVIAAFCKEQAKKERPRGEEYVIMCFQGVLVSELAILYKT